MQQCNRQIWKDPQDIHGGGVDVEADATVEQIFLKRRPQIFVGVFSTKSGRNCATGIFGKTLRIFKEEVWMWKLMQQRNRWFKKDALTSFRSMVIQKWTQLRNRHFSKDPQNCPQRNSGSSSGCNSGTGVFENTP